MTTSMPSLTSDQLAVMLTSLYPSPWTGDDAKVPQGLLYAIEKAFAAGYVTVENQLQFAQNAMRIATATDEALDRVAQDFFGTIIGFPEIMTRLNGESDTSFRQRIVSSLLLDACTKPAIENVLEIFTGSTPRVIEPWNPTETGTFDTNVSYYDYDTPANPARYGDTLPFQFFVESQLPPYHESNLPIYGYDAGLAYDALSTPGGYYLDPQPSWYSGAKQLDALLNRTKALGTTVWRRYSSQALVTYPRAQTRGVPAGAETLAINLRPASAGAYSVLAMPSWNTAVSWKQNSNSLCTLTFSTPAPAGATIDYIITPITNAGSAFAALNTGITSLSVPIPVSLRGGNFVCSPSWNTNVYIDSVTSTVVNLKFSTPSPSGSMLSYVFFPATSSGNQSVSTGAHGAGVLYTPGKPSSPYQAFLTPSWDTAFALTKTGSGFSVVFSDPAPAGAFFTWGTFQS